MNRHGKTFLRSLRPIAVLVVLGNAAQAQPPINSDCAIPNWFDSQVQLYQLCLRDASERLDVAGNAPDTVATAVVDECRPQEKTFATHITDCTGRDGPLVVKEAEPNFHNWAVQDVNEARAKRDPAKPN